MSDDKDYEIKEVDGEKHLIEKGTWGDIDHGVLYEDPLSGKLETRNISGDNFILNDKGIFVRNEKFDVEKSNGEKGTMERQNNVFDHSNEKYRYKTETKRKSSNASKLPGWLWLIWMLILLDWFVLRWIFKLTYLIVKFIVKILSRIHNKVVPHLSSRIGINFHNIPTIAKIFLKILDIVVIYFTTLGFLYLSTGIRISPFALVDACWSMM